MIKVGLTGGIGSGKTYVSKIIESLGYTVFNSDDEAKKIMNAPHVVAQVKEVFGENAYIDSSLNRKYIANLIFSDTNLKEKLNSIVHPAVRQAFVDWSEKQKNDIVFNEAAILFETGAYKQFDYTILVTADEETRIQRVIKRDDATHAEVKARINNQWTDEQKENLASFIIVNDYKKDVLAQIKTIIQQIKKENKLN